MAVTLRALADMIPILGAATVIGGKRAKLFNDGRPITHPTRRSRRNSRRNHDPTHSDNNSSQTALVTDSTSNSVTEINHDLELPERPSPDGEEGETSTEDVEQSVEDDLDNWEDWDINEGNNTLSSNNTTATINSYLNNGENLIPSVNSASLGTTEESDLESSLSTLNLTNRESTDERSVEIIQTTNNSILQINSDSRFLLHKKKVLPDISELDIKNQIVTSVKLDEFDFFQDMEPVIQTSTKYLFAPSYNENDNINSNDYEVQPKKLDLSVAEIEKHEEGWGDEFDWD